MREQGKDMSGFELNGPPRMFIGAAANPFADPFEYRVIRLAKKIDAGADFIQTQCIYNMDRFKEWMKMARDEGLTEKVHILGGLTPLKSAGMAKFMNKNVSGIHVPDKWIEEIGSVAKEDQRKKAAEMAGKFIKQVKSMVQGVHIMPLGWTDVVPEILDYAQIKSA